MSRPTQSEAQVALAAERPVLVALDDAQWLDASWPGGTRTPDGCRSDRRDRQRRTTRSLTVFLRLLWPALSAAVMVAT
jgi:hypothetical protein